MKIALIYTDGKLPVPLPGQLEERDAGIEHVTVALTSLGHKVVKIPAKAGMFEALKKMRSEIDLVFNLADEGYEWDGLLEPQVAAILDILQLRYTGSNHRCLGNCMNKVFTKQLLLANGLPTPKFRVFERKISAKTDITGLKFPLIVKPSMEDGSTGITKNSIVDDKRSLTRQVNWVIKKYHQPALVEEFIDGREISVGVLGRKELTILPLAEIVFTLPLGMRRFLPYDAKWLTKCVYYVETQPKCPAKMDKKLQRSIEKMAAAAYRLMDAKDYARVDFRIDAEGSAHVLEVNPNPNLSADAGLARMAKANGMAYPELIRQILKSALNKD